MTRQSGSKQNTAELAFLVPETLTPKPGYLIDADVAGPMSVAADFNGIECTQSLCVFPALLCCACIALCLNQVGLLRLTSMKLK